MNLIPIALIYGYSLSVFCIDLKHKYFLFYSGEAYDLTGSVQQTAEIALIQPHREADDAETVSCFTEPKCRDCWVVITRLETWTEYSLDRYLASNSMGWGHSPPFGHVCLCYSDCLFILQKMAEQSVTEDQEGAENEAACQENAVEVKWRRHAPISSEVREHFSCLLF